MEWRGKNAGGVSKNISQRCKCSSKNTVSILEGTLGSDTSVMSGCR